MWDFHDGENYVYYIHGLFFIKEIYSRKNTILELQQKNKQLCKHSTLLVNWCRPSLGWGCPLVVLSLAVVVWRGSPLWLHNGCCRTDIHYNLLWLFWLLGPLKLCWTVENGLTQNQIKCIFWKVGDGRFSLPWQIQIVFTSVILPTKQKWEVAYRRKRRQHKVISSASRHNVSTSVHVL